MLHYFSSTSAIRRVSSKTCPSRPFAIRNLYPRFQDSIIGFILKKSLALW